jgi:hypothetical protein
MKNKKSFNNHKLETIPEVDNSEEYTEKIKYEEIPDMEFEEFDPYTKKTGSLNRENKEQDNENHERSGFGPEKIKNNNKITNKIGRMIKKSKNKNR